MTYAEATRQAEEDARWIRNAKLELDKRAERLAKCQAIINAALTVEVVQEPAAVFVHPDDEPEPDPVKQGLVEVLYPIPVAQEGEDAA